MEDNLIKALEMFGLTTKQARVYIAVARAGSMSVGEIAKTSKIYQQDVYKILPKLEELGLIAKTIDKPIAVQATQAENALKNIVATQKQSVLERIAKMENSLKSIVDTIGEWQISGKTGTQKEPHFILLNGETEAMSVADELFEKASLQVDLILSLELLALRAAKFRERFQNAANHGVKTRLIVEHPLRSEKTSDMIRLVTPKSANFTAKFLPTKTPKPFQIIDHKEIWITGRERLPSGLPYVFWTNSADIGEVYEERFEKLWNDPKSVDIAL